MSDIIKNQIKVAIGSLIHMADPAATPVIGSFDSSATRKRSVNVKSFMRFTLTSLEACAELLELRLADSNDNKIFTKATLAPRLVDAIEALLPATCAECSESYIIDLEPTERPIFRCYKCFQGSHDCEDSKSKSSAIANLWLPSGFVWLCHQCLIDNDPIKQRATKTRHNSASKKSTDISRAESGTSTPTESGLNTPPSPKPHKSHTLLDKANQDELRRKLSDVKEEQECENQHSHSDICEKYISGKCPHGIKGNKKIKGDRCPKDHPKRCFKYCSFGTKKKGGCDKGRGCMYFHPTLCKFSVQKRQCFNEKCTFVHLKGTLRPQKTDQKQSRPPSRKELKQSGSSTIPPRKQIGKPTTNESAEAEQKEKQGSFLELTEMVKQMHSHFQQEIASLRAIMSCPPSYLPHPYPPKMMNSNPAPQMQMIPNSAPPMHVPFNPLPPGVWNCTLPSSC